MVLKQSPSLLAKLVLDLAMTLLFIAAISFRATTPMTHVWSGEILCLLFIAHGVINRSWYKRIFKGEYTFRRGVNTVLNLLLPAGALTLGASGLIIEYQGFGLLEGSLRIRQIHSCVAYWGLVVIGVHIGLRWGFALSAVQKMTGVGESVFSRPAARGLVILASAWGVWASFDRTMGSKLFLGASFDFWETGRPGVLLLANNLAILALYIVITRYLFKMILPRAANFLMAKINLGVKDSRS